MRILLPVFILILGICAFAQEPEYVVVENTGDHLRGCFLENEVLTAERLREIREDEDCAKLLPQAIDLTKKTLITYHVGGDCKMSVDVFVTRERLRREFVVHIDNYWGRCRAGGSRNGWLVIGKIPDGHTVRFEEKKLDEKRPSTLIQAMKYPPSISAEEFDPKSCVQLGLSEQRILRSKEDLVAAMKTRAALPECRALADAFDFDESLLFGATISTGYCRKPKGLEFTIQDYAGSEMFVVSASYVKPVGVCRALSRYSFWLKMPQRETDYSVRLIHRQVPDLEASNP